MTSAEAGHPLPLSRPASDVTTEVPTANMEFRDEQLASYLRRAYHAVDGLWFMMVEQAQGFEGALELDRRVWEVLAKIQARKAREVTGSRGDGAVDLMACFSLKLAADGHGFRAEATADAVVFTVHRCPWLELLQGSARQHLACRVAEAICPTEGEVWAREFGGQYVYSMPRMMCRGDDECVMRFSCGGIEPGGASERGSRG